LTGSGTAGYFAFVDVLFYLISIILTPHEVINEYSGRIENKERDQPLCVKRLAGLIVYFDSSFDQENLMLTLLSLIGI
jgi:hypothetical protein